MENNRSDLLPKQELDYRHQSTNSSRNTSLTKKQDIIHSSNSAAHTHAGERGIIVALGFIATLLLFSYMQLYRSVDRNPASTKTIESNRIFTSNINNFNTNNFKEEIHLEKFDSLTHRQKTEVLSIQNAISKGKF